MGFLGKLFGNKKPDHEIAIINNANTIRNGNGFPPISNIEEAASTILLNLICKTALSRSVLPNPENCDATKIILSALFAMYVGESMVLVLKEYGSNIDFNRITSDAVDGFCQLFPKKEIEEIYKIGLDKYGSFTTMIKGNQQLQQLNVNTIKLTMLYLQDSNDKYINNGYGSVFDLICKLSNA